MSRPTLSVVIPTHDGLHLLPACLGSLRTHRPDPSELDLEIIVVDDASSDETAGWLGARFPEARLIRLDTNVGFARAANAGLEAARGEFIQLLNNDAEVTAGWARAGLAPFDDPRVGSVAPLVLVRRDPSRVDSAGDQYAFFGWPTKRGHGEPASDWLDRRPDDVFGPSGSSAFYRASALRDAGPFDSAFGSYYEDVDLAFRLRWAGFTCRHAPGSVVLHDISATYRHDRPDLQRRLARNAEWLFWMNTPPRWWPAALPAHAVFLAVQAAWKARHRRLAPFLRGKLDALAYARSIARARRFRKSLARSAAHPPRFPLLVSGARAARNHAARPPETSRGAGHVAHVPVSGGGRSLVR